MNGVARPLVTILELAKEVEADPQRLIAQFCEAGIPKSSHTDTVSDYEKQVLLTHLKTQYKKSEPRKIKLQRKTTSTLRVAGSKTISVEVKSKRPYNPDVSNHADLEPYDEVSELIGFSGERLESASKVDRWTKLASVEIRNFKAIDSLSLPLADVTILVGPNGSGKSSVLQAVHWAARAASYIEPKKQTEVVSFDRLDYSPSSEPLKTAHKSELSSGRDTPPTMVNFVSSTGEDESGATASVKIWAARNRSGISVSIDGGSAVTPFKQRVELITAYIPGLAGLSEKETILVQPLLRRQAASGDAGGVLRNILFNLANRQPGEIDKSAAEERLAILRKYVQLVHPGVVVEVSFDEREDFHINATFYDERLEGERRPLESAATGVLQVVQIFAYLVLFKPKLLLIDEPDAHLHPDKQERLIEALELAASELQVQAVITTHSPHIARGASDSSKLVWIRDGSIVHEEDDVIKSLLGWGGLDKKVLFFVEDENAQPIKALLRQWPHIDKQVAICRCFGVDNLPRNSTLKGFIEDNNFGVKVLVHRDRDFMTERDTQRWSSRYNTKNVHAWVTDFVDAEAYFCQPEYLASLYDLSKDETAALIKAAIGECKNTRKIFFDKRKVINRMLYEDGGSDDSELLWVSSGEISLSTTVGKTLHAALKPHIKNRGLNEKLLDRFVIPQGVELAGGLRTTLEQMLK